MTIECENCQLRKTRHGAQIALIGCNTWSRKYRRLGTSRITDLQLYTTTSTSTTWSSSLGDQHLAKRGVVMPHSALD
eukprot:6830624-Prymnesium_polylepis.2